MGEKKTTDPQNQISVYRNELKYYICYMDYLKIREILSKFLKTDIHTCSAAGYWIRSLYFDTPDDKEYIEKIVGIDRRKKIRLRLYDVESPKLKLEIKHKHNDYMHKVTTSISRENANRLIGGDKSFLLNSHNTTMN